MSKGIWIEILLSEKIKQTNWRIMMSDYTELLLGCGYRRKKDIRYQNTPKDWQKLVTLDNNPRCNPDNIFNLFQLREVRLPFCNDCFNEIHAYDVLEHLAHQGDHEFFFAEFSEYWRILKPNGLLIATVPDLKSKYALGDPSHKRIITYEQLQFLDQDQYKKVGKSKCSDFRHIYAADFKILSHRIIETDFIFILRANK